MTSNDDRGLATPSRRRLLAATGAAGAGLLAGCLGGGAGGGGGGQGGETTDGSGEEMTGESDGDGEMTDETDGGGGMGWRSIELTTVRDDEVFTVEELDGTVVLQSFAVWCPKCQRQSEALAEVTDSLTVVGLNTDPNEDAAKVREHAEENGFGWRFAVSPTEMTGALIDEFGTTVTNAPSTPLIVACEGGGAKFDAGGVAPAEDVLALADDC